MKTKATKNIDLVKVPDSVLKSLVAEKLKGKVLFAEKKEILKDFLNKVKVSAL